MYEDFLCPNCERFEERYGTDLTTALNANKITVRYHSIAILDERTTPQGYSTRAANAALCSVPAGIFPAYHKKLFDSPARRGQRRPDRRRAHRVRHGARSAQGDFAACVNGRDERRRRHRGDREGDRRPGAADRRPVRHPDRRAIGGKKIDLNNSGWLKDAIAG